MRKVYRIARIDAPNVYKASRKEVDAWVSRNPGEAHSVDQVDALEELERLADELYDEQRSY